MEIVYWDGDEDAKRPEQGYEGDAGWDLYVSKGAWIEAGATVDIQHGLKMELPEGVWAMIVGRSSTMRQRGLLVNLAIIDSGYRGEIFTSVTNIGFEGVAVIRGERISQLIPMALRKMKFERKEQIDEGTARGEKGFGSSGL